MAKHEIQIDQVVQGKEKGIMDNVIVKRMYNIEIIGILSFIQVGTTIVY